MSEALAEFFAKIFSDEAVVFLLSLLPVSEVRGGMIFACAQPELDLLWLHFIIAVIGNLLPIPLILLFLKKVFAWMKTIPKLGKVVDKLMAKAERGSKKLGKYSFWGLYMFVAIPLPGTGAWTGALVADFVDMPLRKAFPPIALGVLTAGVIVTVSSLAVRGIFV